MAQLSVIFAGDSITHGAPGLNYRATVRKAFEGADPAWPDRAPLVLFGESTDDAGTYIGRIGARVEALADPIAASLRLYADTPHDVPAAAPPIAVVLLAGTNNLSGATPATAQSYAADALKAWASVAAKILDGGAAVIAVTVPPMVRSSGELAASQAFNIGIRTLAARLAAAGAPIVVADAGAILASDPKQGIDPDGIHPTAVGYKAIGLSVYGGLRAWAKRSAGASPLPTIPGLVLPLPTAPGPWLAGPGSPGPATAGPTTGGSEKLSTASAGMLLGLIALAWFLLAREGR